MRVYEALTMCRKVGCGNIYVIFNEEDGAFYNLIIKGDNCKETPCGESILNSFASLLTYALRRTVLENNTQQAIVRHLLGHRCNMYTPNKDNIQSCSDAVGKMVLEYLKARNLDELEAQKEEAKV